MSGWGDSLVNGFNAVSDAKDKKKQRQLDELSQQMRLDMQAKQLSSDRELQNQRLGADAANLLARFTHDDSSQEKDQGFKAGESDKDRTFRTSERQGTEGFQGNQSQLDRDARMAALSRQLETEKNVKAAELDFQNKKFDWEKDPTNPYNLIRGAQSAGWMARPDVQDAIERGTMPSIPGMQFTAPAPASVPSFGKDAEGKMVTGPDGKTYVIKNGKPVAK